MTTRHEQVAVRFLLAAVVAVAGIGGAVACSSNSPSSPSGASGTLNLRLTDSPFGDAKAVLVAFSEVTAHRDTDADFSKLPFAGGASRRVCDLKKLEAAEDILGTGLIPAGHYTQVRLVVSSATLYFDNVAAGPACAPAIDAPAGRSASLTIPSGEVKLSRQFDVPAAGAATMLLDFDGDQSIRQMGNGGYSMTPVIRVVSVQ